MQIHPRLRTDRLPEVGDQFAVKRADLGRGHGYLPHPVRTPPQVNGRGHERLVHVKHRMSIAPDPRPAAQAWQNRRELDLSLLVRGTGHKALPGTRQEVQALAGLVPSTTLLLGSVASEQSLTQLRGTIHRAPRRQHRAGVDRRVGFEIDVPPPAHGIEILQGEADWIDDAVALATPRFAAMTFQPRPKRRGRLPFLLG